MRIPDNPKQAILDSLKRGETRYGEYLLWLKNGLGLTQAQAEAELAYLKKQAGVS